MSYHAIVFPHFPNIKFHVLLFFLIAQMGEVQVHAKALEADVDSNGMLGNCNYFYFFISKACCHEV